MNVRNSHSSLLGAHPTKSVLSVIQFFCRVTGSTGMARRYPLLTKSSSDVGPASLSEV